MPCFDYQFSELKKEKVSDIAGLRRELSLHLSESPCFMKHTAQDVKVWLAQAEKRNSRVFVAMQNGTIVTLKAKGYTSLGVDFESFNSTAYGFWMKYFTAYTHSVVRRIDDRILEIVL